MTSANLSSSHKYMFLTVSCPSFYSSIQFGQMETLVSLPLGDETSFSVLQQDVDHEDSLIASRDHALIRINNHNQFVSLDYITTDQYA